MDMAMMKALENIQSTLDKLVAYQHDKGGMDEEKSPEDMDTVMDDEMPEEGMGDMGGMDEELSEEEKKKKPALKISIMSKPVKRAFG